VRFTADEYAELADAAAGGGVTTTGYVEEAALAARVILYHRHVGPVLVRDWSIRMDLFTATVEASTDLEIPQRRRPTQPPHRQGRPRAGRRRVSAADPAQSDYLDAATNPVPWPNRTETRQPRGGRPMVGAEKRLTGSKRPPRPTRTTTTPP
jgi:hypothetical protein